MNKKMILTIVFSVIGTFAAAVIAAIALATKNQLMIYGSAMLFCTMTGVLLCNADTARKQVLDAKCA